MTLTPEQQALIDKIYGEQKCDVCGKSPIKGVAAIPFVPISVAYCAECPAANAHPWDILVANQAMLEEPLETMHPEWQQMVTDTCTHLGTTIDEFKRAVEAEIIVAKAEQAEFEAEQNGRDW